MQKEVAKEQLAAMKNVWDSRSKENKVDIKPTFLLLGINYDGGVKVYNRKATYIVQPTAVFHIKPSASSPNEKRHGDVSYFNL